MQNGSRDLVVYLLDSLVPWLFIGTKYWYLQDSYQKFVWLSVIFYEKMTHTHLGAGYVEWYYPATRNEIA